MKSYTDLEESKKLAEILPIESADMGLYYSKNPNAARNQMWVGTKVENSDIPCWSLSALFEVMPKCVEGAEPSLIKTFRNDYRIVYDIHGDEGITSEDYTNPVDACYEMILKLHELKML